MCDVYIYYFIPSNERNADLLSTRPATLEAIRGRGEPVMATQLVVDHTELDGDGFLVASAGNISHEIDNIAAQIASLETRAASRDNEASASADGIEQYMLSLESRELRNQARLLKTMRTELVAVELESKIDPQDSIQFGYGAATQ